jgi:AcrR family transcriptional regulator
LTGRSTAQEEKRRVILDAAVRVFARRGYHASRVGDIAEEAGVAHGLLYHYFRSKDEVLATIFRENWTTLVDRFRAVAASEEPAEAKLRGIAKILLRSWVHDPGLVTVMIREVARSQHVHDQVAEIREGFEVIRGVIAEGCATGELRRDLDPVFAAWIFYGGLEELLTGWVLDQLPHSERDVARAEEMAVAILCGGLRG